MRAKEVTIDPIPGRPAYLPSTRILVGLPVTMFATIVVSIEISRAMTQVAPLWLPPSLLLALLLRSPARNWPTLLLIGGAAAVAGNIVGGNAPLDALVHGLLNSVVPWLMAVGFGRLKDTRPWYLSSRWVRSFLLICAVGSALSATVGAGWYFMTYEVPSELPFFRTWAEWFASNAMGYVMGTLFLLSWTEPALRSGVTVGRLLEAALLTCVTAAVSLLAFTTQLPLFFMVYPILALATVRGGLPGATAGTIAFASVAMWSMVEGVGPIATLTDLSLFERALILRACLFTALLSTIPIAVVLALRGTVTQRLRQRVVAEQRMRVEAQSLAHHAMLRSLRYQLNPHFLFNTLNSIAALVVDRRPDEAERMINRLSDFLRAGLDTDPLEEVPLATEIAQQRRYLEIEHIRFPNRLAFHFDIAPEAEEALVPSLILQPLVENAIKYAVAPSPRLVTVSIEAAVEGDQLKIVVRDDGQGGFGAGVGAGIGLTNVRQRLASTFGEAASFSAGPGEGRGYAVDLRMPLKRAG